MRMIVAWVLFNAHGITSNTSLFHSTEKLRTTPLISVLPSIRYRPGAVLGGEIQPVLGDIHFSLCLISAKLHGLNYTYIYAYIGRRSRAACVTPP